jgi:uncharacterized protein (DUF983 family)
MDSQPQAFGGAASGRWSALKRGFGCRCPRCGRGAIFGRYVTVNHGCRNCGLVLDGYRVDDAPPYFTILLVGHIIVPGMLLLEEFAHPAVWLHMTVWLPLTLLLTLLLLPRVKGALIGIHWANGIKG